MEAVTPVVEGLEIYEQKIADGKSAHLSLHGLRSIDGRVMSRWRPTEEERRALLAGADIFLTIVFGSNLYQPAQLVIIEKPSADFILHDFRLDDALELRMMADEIHAISEEERTLHSLYHSKLSVFQARKEEIERQISAGSQGGAE